MTFTSSLKQRLSEVQSQRIDAEKRSLKELERKIVGHDVVRNTTKMTEVKVDSEVLAVREKECGGCEHREGDVCRQTSCFINVITLIPMFECPIGKW